MAGCWTQRGGERKNSHRLQGREQEDLKGGDRELLRVRWRKKVWGGEITVAWQREGVMGGAGRDQDTKEGRQGSEGPGLTAALALSADRRLCQFRHFFLL